METLEIHSLHSLTTSMIEKRPEGEHTYQLTCRQFNSTYRSWQKNSETRAHALGVMTLGFERIWITPEEVSQVAAAIQSERSPITLG